MTTLVPDALILLKLEDVGLLESAFSCGLSMVVPDSLFEKELENENGTLLRSLGLEVVSLTSSEMKMAQDISTQCVSLSNTDCQLIVCGQRANHALAVWNLNLDREAKSNKVKTYNLLWVLDQMDVHGKVNPELLCQALNKIKARNSCALPPSGVRSRIERWEKRI